MSLTLSSFRYLAWVGTRLQLRGPVLVLGRQMVFGSAADIAWALRTQGRQPRNSGSKCDGPNIPGIDLVTYGGFTNDIFALRMLIGDEPITAVDIDGYQGADLVHDISNPFPEAHLDRYGLIIDAGTLEHVFDVKSSLDNLVSCLRDGGSLVHMSPSNGYLGHGYYQFSPSLFIDYYTSQGMQIDNITLVEQPLRRTNHDQWTFWHWDNAIMRKKMVSGTPLATFCAASKSGGVIPASKVKQDFAEYLRRSSDAMQFERRPWGLRRIDALAPTVDYPLA